MDYSLSSESSCVVLVSHCNCSLYSTLQPFMIYDSGLKKENPWCIRLLSLNWEISLWEKWKQDVLELQFCRAYYRIFSTQNFQLLTASFLMENILLLPSLLPRNHLDINCHLLGLDCSGVTANSRLLYSTCWHHNTQRHQENSSYDEVKTKLDNEFLLSQTPSWKL